MPRDRETGGGGLTGYSPPVQVMVLAAPAAHRCLGDEYYCKLNYKALRIAECSQRA
jgi:hypothetical protein